MAENSAGPLPYGKDFNVYEKAPLEPFDPDADRYLVVPLVRLDAGEVTVVRGELPEWAVAFARRRAGLGYTGLFGVFHNEIGDIELCASGETAYDWRQISRIEFADVIDSPATEDEYLAQLERLRDDMLRRRAGGWVLVMADRDGFVWWRPLHEQPDRS